MGDCRYNFRPDLRINHKTVSASGNGLTRTWLHFGVLTKTSDILIDGGQAIGMKQSFKPSWQAEIQVSWTI